MRFDMPKGSPLAGVAALAAMLLFTALAMNDWDIDKIRPEVNRDSDMVVHEESVDNTELNAILSVDVGDDANTSMDGPSSDSEMDSGSLEGAFAANDATRVSHDDYVKYLKSSVVAQMDVVMSTTDAASRSKLYMKVFYRGHIKEEKGGAAIVKIAPSAFSEGYTNAGNIGGIAITQFATSYLYDLHNNTDVFKSRQKYIESALKDVPDTTTWMEACADNKLEVPLGVKRMWGTFAGVGSGNATTKKQYVHSATLGTETSAVKYLPDVEFTVASSATIMSTVVVNDTGSKYQSGNTYVPMMTKEALDLIGTSYCQYTDRDSPQRKIFYEDDNTIAQCIDSGYSSLVIIFGCEAGTTLNQVIGSENKSKLATAIRYVIPDTSFDSSVFSEAVLIQKGEVAVA